MECFLIDRSDSWQSVRELRYSWAWEAEVLAYETVMAYGAIMEFDVDLDTPPCRHRRRWSLVPAMASLELPGGPPISFEELDPPVSCGGDGGHRRHR